MSGTVRVLGPSDMASVRALLDRNPLENLFVNARLDAVGLNSGYLSCRMWGWEEAGELTALCYVGTNLVPINAGPEALDAFARKLGPQRICASIMGAADQTRELYERLALHWGDAWSKPREIRAHQPLMAVDGRSLISPDERIGPISPTLVQPYMDAAVAMYTEEVGVSPLDGTHGYESYVRSLIMMGRAYGAYDAISGKVWFKADIGCEHDWACQIQGVWLDPMLRGRGIAAPAMAQVVGLCLRAYPVVSLYVNDFNIRARRVYERIGFKYVSELATVLY